MICLAGFVLVRIAFIFRICNYFNCITSDGQAFTVLYLCLYYALSVLMIRVICGLPFRKERYNSEFFYVSGNTLRTVGIIGKSGISGLFLFPSVMLLSRCTLALAFYLLQPAY